jgi:ArsR family transcriptional regulator, arsenate/arsenite/antimonite-responsive transcriptional repressor
MKALRLVKSPCCVPGSPPLPEPERQRLATQFKALGDPTRLAIVNQLAGSGECCVCALDGLGLSQPTVSHHLRILRDAGLVESTRRGTWAYYRLVPAAVEALGFALTGGDQQDAAERGRDARQLDPVEAL